VGLLLLTALTVGPLLAERPPVDFVPPFASAVAATAARAAVLLLMGMALAVRARADRAAEPGAARNMVLFAGLAAAMTACHWHYVDQFGEPTAWQRARYLAILNHAVEPVCANVPHVFRPLPYGFARLLERLTGDWRFACLAYRWFFTTWFLWAAYRFARLFQGSRRALLVLAPLALLYPLSVRYYWGQLTDPLSHTLFVLGMAYAVEDRPVALAAAVALGVLTKETAVLLVPAYLAAHFRTPRGWLAAAGAGLAAVAAYLTTRLPLGWRPGYGQINGTAGSMLWTNLGVGDPLYQGAAPPAMNYLHPLLFVGVFLPAVAWRWCRLDPRLRALVLTLVPLLLWTNLEFGWMYESRNYMPLVPLLATAALPRGGREGALTAAE
jgi:hypothetical protein